VSDILLPLDGLDQRSGGQEVPWCTKLEPVHYCWRRIVYFFPFYLRSKSWTRESDGPHKNTGHLGLFLLPAVHGAEAVPWCFLLTGRGVQRGAGALPANLPWRAERSSHGMHADAAPLLPCQWSCHVGVHAPWTWSVRGHAALCRASSCCWSRHCGKQAELELSCGACDSSRENTGRARGESFR